MKGGMTFITLPETQGNGIGLSGGDLPFMADGASTPRWTTPMADSILIEGTPVRMCRQNDRVYVAGADIITLFKVTAPSTQNIVSWAFQQYPETSILTHLVNPKRVHAQKQQIRCFDADGISHIYARVREMATMSPEEMHRTMGYLTEILGPASPGAASFPGQSPPAGDLPARGASPSADDVPAGESAPARRGSHAADHALPPGTEGEGDHGDSLAQAFASKMGLISKIVLPRGRGGKPPVQKSPKKSTPSPAEGETQSPPAPGAGEERVLGAGGEGVSAPRDAGETVPESTVAPAPPDQTPAPGCDRGRGDTAGDGGDDAGEISLDTIKITIARAVLATSLPPEQKTSFVEYILTWQA